MTQEPQSVYETRVEARRAELRLLEERDRRLSLARAIVASLAPNRGGCARKEDMLD